MKKMLLIGFIIAIAFLVGCSTNYNVNANTSENFSLTRVGGYNKFELYVDNETGVNYIVNRGHIENSITVRYNNEGNIYVSK